MDAPVSMNPLTLVGFLLFLIWEDAWVAPAMLLVLSGALASLVMWRRRPLKRRWVVIKRLDECPECGSGWIRREPAGTGWQIWCRECSTVSLAQLAPHVPRPAPGEQ